MSVIQADTINRPEGADLNFVAVQTVMPVDETIADGGGMAVDNSGNVVTMNEVPKDSGGQADAAAISAAAPYTHSDMDSWNCQTLKTNIDGMIYTLNNARLSQAGFAAYQQAIYYASNLSNAKCQVVPQTQTPLVEFPIEAPVDTVTTVTPVDTISLPAPTIHETEPEIVPILYVDAPEKVNPAIETLTPPATNPYVTTAMTAKDNTTADAPAPAATPDSKFKNYFWLAVGITTIAGFIFFNKESKI